MSGKHFEGFKILEEKIEKAAEVIRRIRDERDSIEEENKKLKEEIEMLYTKNDELKSEFDRLKENRHNQEDFEKVREEISNRIEVMLEKLDEIDI